MPVLPGTMALLDRSVAGRRLLGGYLHVRQHGHVVADVAVGEASPGVPAHPGDVGETRCTGKLLTTVCLARAAERGDLDLDDSLKRWASPGTVPEVASMTVRQLLTHTSGLANRVPPPLYSVDFHEFVHLILTTPQPPAWREPKPIYNMARAWHLLGWVVEQVYRAPLPEVVASEVARPLGLHSVAMVDHHANPYFTPALGGGYKPVLDTDPEVFRSRLNPAYGVVADVGDVCALYDAVRQSLGVPGLVGCSMAREMVRDHGSVSVWQGDTSPRSYGLGLYLGGPANGLGPAWAGGTFGHYGTIAGRMVTLAVADPASGVAMALRLASLRQANSDLVDAIGLSVRADLDLPSSVTT